MVLVRNFRTNFVLLLLIAIASQVVAQNAQSQPAVSENLRNNLVYAVAWKQTAAEHHALFYQGFSLARTRVELALARREPGARPLAIVSDVDETLLLESLQLKHNGHARNYSLKYRFDFAKDGILRTGGSVLITPGHHPTVIINTSDGQLIQEIH